jgi:SAM-dependent methyltransferase
MTDAAIGRSYGKVFDAVAAEYDRHRPVYPAGLIAHGCELAGLTAGDTVLELGCGTGQLTRNLLARGLKVTAVEPGERLIALAAESLAEVGTGTVNFVNARLEDAELPRGAYRAAFAAASLHWMDPDVSWRRVADALAPGGTFVLLQYFGLDEEWSAADREAVNGTIARIAPELADEWPTYPNLEETLAAIELRAENVSEVWSWLGGYTLAREYVTDLFERATVATVPTRFEHTASELNALLGTMSFWSRLSQDQRQALERENELLYGRLARPIRSSTAATLVTARRANVNY